jgi:hypothetical protein
MEVLDTQVVVVVIQPVAEVDLVVVVVEIVTEPQELTMVA